MFSGLKNSICVNLNKIGPAVNALASGQHKDHNLHSDGHFIQTDIFFENQDKLFNDRFASSGNSKMCEIK